MRRRIALGAVLSLATLIGVANAIVLLGGRGAAPPHAQAALILGALVEPDGRLSRMLEDRVQAGARLYREGRVDKLLVSGDHHRVTYDEVTPMRKRLIELGVPARDIFEDHAGFDTWASVVRARKVSGLDNAIIVTQDFHLSRAVFLARRAGLDASGVSADTGGYGALGLKADAREVLARFKALGSAVFTPRPTYLGPPISISGDGRVSWGPVDREGPSL